MTKIELKYAGVQSIVSEKEIIDILATYPTEKEHLKLFVERQSDLINRGVRDGLISVQIVNSL